MPILIHKDGWTGQQVVLFVGPDSSGDFAVGETIEVPAALDPLADNELSAFVNESEIQEEFDSVQLDYSDVHPTNKEQILRVTGLNLYRKKFYLSSLGDGASLGQRPKPQPKEHEYEIVSFGSIRNAGEYRRDRVYNKENTSGNVREVVGWISTKEHNVRMGYERK